jgi:GMP synthase-like glutamine amidotransferase
MSIFKIGILECDRLSEPLRKKHGSYSEMFQKLLGVAGESVAFTTYQVMDSEYPARRDDCDAYLITGSHHSVYEDLPWIKLLQEYVVTLDKYSKKLVGICFGHQLVAQALGGQVGKHPGGWGLGIAASKLLQRKAWMEPLQDPFHLIASHQDQVLRLPPRAELLAGNAFCAHGSYQIGEHILCFQGHPEFSHAYARERLLTRKDIVGADTMKQALDSLQRTTDAPLIARWIIKFLMR